MRLLLLSILIAINALAQEEKPEEVKLDPQKQSYQRLLNTKYVLLPHRDTYLLPYVFNAIPHESVYEGYKKIDANNKGDLYKKEEAEFQVSFMLPVFRKMFDSNFDFNFSYTHRAWWQIYNSQWSRPFRETNYNPELFVRYMDTKESSFLGLDLMAADFGYSHQSNGQIQVISRSWDRIFARAYLRNKHFALLVSGWYRIPEGRSVDQNPGIYNYMGLGEIELFKSFGKHTLHYRTPIFAHHFSSDLRYSYPFQERFRWYVSIQSGYGQSLIEYNRPTQRYGVGIAMDSLLDSGKN